jgi:hypothetical protein
MLFLAGVISMRFDKVDVLADYLGLELTKRKAR